MNKILDDIRQSLWPILFFALASIVILWQMLMPGYILTLDMIFTPEVRIFLEPGAIYNNVPFRVLILVLSYIVPVWFIQKIILFGIFFTAGFGAYRFLSVPKKFGADYWTGVLYMANPFVYERLLAGHYLILLAYAALPAFTHYLVEFYRNPTLNNSLKLFTTLLLIGIFSLHLLAMVLMVTLAVALVRLLTKDFHWIKSFVLGGIAFTILSLYWLIPFLINFDQANILGFNEQNWKIFSTASDQHLGTSLNVLSLYGFWGEKMPWAGYFIWPKDTFIFWLGMFVCLAAIAILGFIKKVVFEKRPQALFFLGLGLVGFVFSTGVGDSIFKIINEFMFDHVWFWRGFRDTQKWSVLLIISYVYFGGHGVHEILTWCSRLKLKEAPLKFVTLTLFLIPVLYTYTIWGGFSRQLQPVWYPNSWHGVKQILDQDESDFKVLYLPWHQYLSLEFNQRLVTLNPAKEFFGPKIVQAENIELGPVYGQGGDTLTKNVEDVLMIENASQDQILALLKDLGLKYIIYSHGFEADPGPVKFQPVESIKLMKIEALEGLTLFEIM